MVHEAQDTGDTVTQKQLRQEAYLACRIVDPLTTFKASNGWLESAFSALNLEMRTPQGEKAKADEEGAHEYVESLCHFLQHLGLSPDHMFNADESKINFIPKRQAGVVEKGAPAPKSRGEEKEGMTVMPCVNATGLTIKISSLKFLT